MSPSVVAYTNSYNTNIEGKNYGDTNGDGEVNITDSVLIAQYLAQWEVKIDMSASDCRYDGKIDTKDAVLLAQYLAKWDVTLGPKTQEEDPEVIDAVYYSKKISSEFDNVGLPDTHHTVILPKINYNTDAAVVFNKKIMEKHGDSIEILKAGEEERTVYKISYSFSVCNGIVGIMISDSRSVINAYKDQDYFGYYYDTKNDKELNFFADLEALGIDYAKMVSEINKTAGQSIKYSTDYTDYEISAAIFKNSSFIAELPYPTWGSHLEEIPVSIVGSSDVKYDVSDILMKWYQKNKNEFDSSQYDGDLSSIKFYDLDVDGADEICFVYEDYQPIYIFYRLENGIYNMDCDIGTESGSGYFQDITLFTGSDGIVSAYFTALWEMFDVRGYDFIEYRFTNGEWTPNEESRMYLTETLTSPTVYKYSTKSQAADDYTKISKERYDEIIDWYFDNGYPIV